MDGLSNQSLSAGLGKWLSLYSSLPSHLTHETISLVDSPHPSYQLWTQPGQSPLLPAESLQQPSLLPTPLRVILLEHVLLTRMVVQTVIH